MAKPMLVTLPFVLLLLDYWPLRRIGEKEPVLEIRGGVNKPVAGDKRRGKSRKRPPVEGGENEKRPATDKHPWGLIRPLLWEKLPLFALTALFSILAYISEEKGGAVGSWEIYPAGERLANAFVSYIVYVGKMIWPVHLGVYYPYPGLQPLWQVLGAVFIFVAGTAVVIRMAKRFPFLAVGWLWYAGTLVPVIGLVQVGSHAMADRYTYIPLIGLFIMAAWGIPELLKGRRYRKEALFLASALSLSGLIIVTWAQVGNWRDSLTQFEHAFKVTVPNSTVYKNRGSAHARVGNYREAMGDLNRAIELNPKNAVAYHNRAAAYLNLRNFKQAVEDLKTAARLGNANAQRSLKSQGISWQ